jgi:hypothetical protein
MSWEMVDEGWGARAREWAYLLEPSLWPECDQVLRDMVVADGTARQRTRSLTTRIHDSAVQVLPGGLDLAVSHTGGDQTRTTLMSVVTPRRPPWRSAAAQ